LSSSSEPEALIKQLLGALNPATLESLLGTTLAGEPFSKLTLGSLAGSLGTTPEALAGDLGTSPEQLPASAMALTAPLTDGKTLGVLDGHEGLDLGVIAPSGAGTAGAPGGSGGTGGTSTGTPAGTTILVSMPASTPTALAPTATAVAVAVTPAGKLRIVSHKVKGKVATIVVQSPAAGKLTLGANGIVSSSHQTAKAETVTLRAVLAKAGVASLRKHHRLKVTLKVSFKQAGGPSSSATVAVTFG
jgi:hypothetical protein